MAYADSIVALIGNEAYDEIKAVNESLQVMLQTQMEIIKNAKSIGKGSGLSMAVNSSGQLAAVKAEAKEIQSFTAQVRSQQLADEKELNRLIALEIKEKNAKALADEKELNRLIKLEEKQALSEQKAAYKQALIEKKAADKEYTAWWAAQLKEREAAAKSFQSRATTYQTSYSGSSDTMSASAAQAGLSASQNAEAAAVREAAAAQAVYRAEKQATIQVQARSVAMTEAEIAAELEQETTLISLRAQLKALKLEYVGLTATQRQSAEGVELIGQIQKTDTAVKGLEKTMGESQRNVGNYQSALTKGFSNIWSGLRKIAYIVPGLGIAGIFALAADALIPFMKNLFTTVDKFGDLNAALKEGQKNALAEVVTLKNLYDATQNTNLSIDQRLVSVKKLQELYPVQFANLSQEVILNGDAKDSYDKLTASIYATAKAKAIESKQVEILSKGLDEETRLRQNLEKAKDEGARKFNETIKYQTRAYGGGVNQSELSLSESRKLRAEKAVVAQQELDDFHKAQDKELAILQDAQVQQTNLIIKTEKDKVVKVKKVKDTAAKEEADRIKQQYLKEAADFETTAAINKEIVDDEKHSLDTRLAAYDAYSSAIMQAVLHKDLAEKKSAEQTNNDLVEQTIKLTKERSKIISDAAKDDYETNKEYASKFQDVLDQINAERKVKDEFNAQEQKKIQDLLIDFAFAAQEAIQTALDGAYQKQIQNEQKILDSIQTTAQAKIDAVNGELISEEEKQKKIAAINARATADAIKEQEKINAIKRKQAIVDRALAIARIIENTAIAVTSVLSIPIYGEIEAAIIAAIGAAQIAAVLATPLPAYKEGTGNSKHPGGKAWVGDGGQMEVIDENGKIRLTPSTPTLVDMEPGAIVYPSVEDWINRTQGMTQKSMDNVARHAKGNGLSTAEMERLLRRVANGVEAVYSKEPIVINDGFEAYYQRKVKN